MAVFGLELDHIKPELVIAGDNHQVYFFLDLLNVLLDSIFQAKQMRLGKTPENVKDLTESSGGEEISKILDFARKTYGRVQSFKKDDNKQKVSNGIIQPKWFGYIYD